MMNTGRLTARLLLDPPLDGALNMARDEALLELRTLPTLRFYRWSKPTLSLGYFQKASDLPLDAARARGCEIVRRTTGGKAILHEHELTYSICLPETGVFTGDPAESMETLHTSLLNELAQQSGQTVSLRKESVMTSDIAQSEWCFEDSSPLDIALEGRKLLGSAARRRKGWVLFHGSLVLTAPQETPRIGALGAEPDIPRLVRAFEQGTQYTFAEGSWTPEELSSAKRIAKEKFALDSFTLLR
ncbi:MAG TPA: biotin/lipoate A/B protein ligase family protein [Planctomycetota bacterium]|jgi:lipoate-protein ligase A|nr:biotin/lipoate A/B protein ligase family protein [Planctomycetota bacterium]HJM38995.1 biotin/lipoate A/B protein ligase family protein [Planctomycetota bacterium]|tara:strand:+ start:5317 stop:6048 length:732 start_codon:yes stop_codon:yes gene_type:complete